QDVVVLAERQQEDEQQERQDEGKTGLPGDPDEHEHGQPQGREVGEHHRRDQVQRRDQRAQHQREQDGDDRDGDRDDRAQVTVGQVGDVVGERRLAGDPGGRGAGGPRGAGGRRADGGYRLRRRRGGRAARRQRGGERDGVPVGAHERAAGPVGLERGQPGGRDADRGRNRPRRPVGGVQRGVLGRGQRRAVRV